MTNQGHWPRVLVNGENELQKAAAAILTMTLGRYM